MSEPRRGRSALSMLTRARVLGFAFRDRPPDPLPVGVVAGPASGALSQALAKSSGVRPVPFATREDGLAALRIGKIALLVEEAPDLVYRFDPTRPDARLARL